MPSLAEKQADDAITIAMEFAEVKLSLGEMIDHVFLETHIILGSQRARLLGGLIEEPDGDQIERAAKNMAVLRFYEGLRDHPDKAIAWLRSRANG